MPTSTTPPGFIPTTKPAGAIPLPGAAVTDLLTRVPGRAHHALRRQQRSLHHLRLHRRGWQAERALQPAIRHVAAGRTAAEIHHRRSPRPGVEDQPDNLDNLVWVEGEITAAYGEFFNVLYVQDETGGITVHAPAGDIDPSAFTRGTHVRVVGTIGIYNGDTEIEFFEAEMVQVIPGDGYNAHPIIADNHTGFSGRKPGLADRRIRHRHEQDRHRYAYCR